MLHRKHQVGSVDYDLQSKIPKSKNLRVRLVHLIYIQQCDNLIVRRKEENILLKKKIVELEQSFKAAEQKHSTGLRLLEEHLKLSRQENIVLRQNIAQLEHKLNSLQQANNVRNQEVQLREEAYKKQLMLRHREIMQLQMGMGTSANPINNQWEVDPSAVHIIHEIGSGGFGKVFEATWAGMKVAVKKVHDGALSANAQQSFLNEVKLMGSLRHANIVQFIGACTTIEQCIIMEYLPRGSLEKLLYVEKAHLNTGQMIKFSQDIAAGIELY